MKKIRKYNVHYHCGQCAKQCVFKSAFENTSHKHDRTNILSIFRGDLSKQLFEFN